MPRQSTNLLCSYRYDPLDRMVACTPSAQSSIQRFYLKKRLATEIRDSMQDSIMQHDERLLAQQHRQSGSSGETSLLATDQQRSVLTLLDANRPHAFIYMPYGHHFAGGGLHSLLGFNGERPDPVTGWYLLGNGYRAFNPVLMRFNSPDSWSPFGKGGLNAYGYCVGDPINRSDPTGHVNNPFKGLLNMLGRKPSRERANRANRAAEVAVETYVDTSPAQVQGAPRREPPRYSESTPQSHLGGMSQQELNVPPPTYHQSTTNLMSPSSSPGNSPSPQVHFSSSTPNLEPPPPYFAGQVSTRQQPRQNKKLESALAHRQRILEKIQGIPYEQIGPSTRDTLDSLNKTISEFRQRP